MSDSPRVSIICLCYNHEDFVLDALNSAESQSHPNIELIIIDDCSTDNSLKLITQWNQNRGHLVINNKINLGNTKSFNLGLSKATGDFIIDLATDDILLPHFVSSHLITFSHSQFQNLGVVYSNVENIDKSGNHLKYHFPINSDQQVKKALPVGNIYAQLIERYFINSPSMMVAKKVFDKLNGYDENLSYEDLDFWVRSSRIFNYDFTDAILVKKRILPNSHGKKFYSKRGKKLSESTLIICKKAYKLNKNKAEYKALSHKLKYETILNLKVGHYYLTLKFVRLYLKCRIKAL